MAKAFVLASLALTGVLGFGGGVLEMVKLGEVTPDQLLRLLALLLPLAASLTLPVAALFSAAATYGRLSADNEFVACRSSGINLYVLFVPTLVLSLVSAGVSFGFTNYLVPGMVRNLNEFVRADVGALIQQRLKKPQGITLGKNHRMHADRSFLDPEDPNHVILEKVAFVEMDEGEWIRYGTARQIDLTFKRFNRRTRIEGTMWGLSYYDRRQGQFFEESFQTIPGNDLPSMVPLKVKYLELHELFYYWANPTEWASVKEDLDRLRQKVGGYLVYDDLESLWRKGQKRFTLGKGDLIYQFYSTKAARGPTEGEFVLEDVKIEETRGGKKRTLTALSATFELTHAEDIRKAALMVDLRGVTLSDGTTQQKRAKEMLGPIAIDATLLEKVAMFDEGALVSQSKAFANDPFAKVRAYALESKDSTVRRIIGALSERTAFSVSVFVLVILAAALGIIFRGSHVMVAFGISFVPALFVILSIVMGRQMSHNADTHLLGLIVMWSGIVMVAGIDMWTLKKVLRR